MKIGIMGAMTEEVDIIRSHMSNISETSHGGRKYYCGKINNTDVVLAFSRWGKVAATSTVTSMIDKFNIKKLIFTGVAGATSELLNIGDIVISKRLYQHDMDASPLFPKHQIPLTGITFFNADSALIKKATEASNSLIASLETKIPKATLTSFNIKTPKCVVGTIASGDKFIASSDDTKLIMSENPDTLAVEMEGAAVAQVCHDHKIPFVVIRTISDKANHKAVIDFAKFIKMVTSHYSDHIIKNMLSNSSDTKDNSNDDGSFCTQQTPTVKLKS